MQTDIPELLKALKNLYPTLRYTQIIAMVIAHHCPWYKNPDPFYIDDESLKEAMMYELFPDMDKTVTI